ncbi:facilitated trehalose transporter Tret1-like [Culicoides brevitarsis]|uniref:facilitated trehalose transporter Tret1-like n=1 Tax=Culicoides brevitarsis TaxID=469753 RepID=UPI00307B51E1
MKPAHRQYYAAFCANLATVLYGIFISWSSPYIPLLQSENSPLKNRLSDEEASWIAAIGGFGGLASTFLCGWLLDRIGRKKTLILIGIPQIICWVLILYGTTANQLLVARILGGLSGGGAFTVVPVFVSEIADDDRRGNLGTIFSVSCNFGIFLGFVITTFFEYHFVPKIVLAMALMYSVNIMFVKESPNFHKLRGNYAQAEESNKYYTGNKVQEFVKESNNNFVKEKLRLSDFKNPAYWKPTIMSLIVTTFCTVSGSFVIICFTKQILDEAGSPFSSEMGSIIIAFIQFLGSYVASLVIERLGRKLLLLTSAIVATISLSIAGSYYYLKSLEQISPSYSATPLVCVSVLFFIVAAGLATVPIVVVTEILPHKIRGLIFTLCMAELWTIIILGVRYFMAMSDAMGMHGFLWFFAGTSFVAAAFIGLCLPETKGKSIDTIAGFFNK